MNGLNGLRRLFGLHPMNEAPAAEAPAAASAAPAAEAPAAPSAPVGLLGGEAAPAEAPATEAPAVEAPAPAEAKPAEAPAVAPETYEAFTAPEGMELNPEIMPELGEVFKELNLPQDKAQGLLNRLLEIQAKAEGSPEQQLEAQERQIIELNAQLAEQTKNLPEIGGENFAKSLEVAGKVMAKFGTPELRELLNYTALASHPEMFKFIHAIGAAMSDDVFENGGAAPGGQKSLAERLWPSSN